jgi:hypothetical protein
MPFLLSSTTLKQCKYMFSSKYWSGISYTLQNWDGTFVYVGAEIMEVTNFLNCQRSSSKNNDVSNRMSCTQIFKDYNRWTLYSLYFL